MASAGDSLKNLIMEPYIRTQDDEASARTLMPTLFIGLGRTGIQILAPLKKRLNAHYSSFGERRDVFQFLMLDIGEPEGQGADAMEYIDFMPLKVENVRLVVNQLSHEHKCFSRWWECGFTPPKKDLSDGTGGIRQLGRLALLANYVGVRNRLAEKCEISLGAFKSAQASAENPPAMKIHIVSSTCGGAGSGTLIDMLFLIHKMIAVEKAVPVEVSLTLVMPSAFIDRLYISFKQFRLLHANTYAFLKELNALVTEGGDNLSKEFWKYSLEDIDEKDSLPFTTWRPFNRCFILDNRTQQSKIIPYEKLCSIASHKLFMLTLMTFPGNEARSAGMLLSGTPFYTVGFLRFHCRYESVMGYLVRKLAADMIDRWGRSSCHDPRLAGIIDICRKMREDAEKEDEEELNRARIQAGLAELLEKGLEATKAQVPVFMPFAKAAKIVQTAQSQRDSCIESADRFFNEFRNILTAQMEEANEKMAREMNTSVESHLLKEGPAAAHLAVEKFLAFMDDYHHQMADACAAAAARESEAEERLAALLERISQKQELHAAIDEFFSALSKRIDFSFVRRMCQLHGDILSSFRDAAPFQEIEKRITAVEGFLKTARDRILSGIDDIERFQERDNTVISFPSGEIRDSSPVIGFYRECCTDEEIEDHNCRFVEYMKEFLPMESIYESPDADSEKIFIQMICRYALSALKDSMDPSVSSSLLLEKEENSGAYMEDILSRIVPSVLFELSDDRERGLLLWSSGKKDAEGFHSMVPGLLPKEQHCLSDEVSDTTFLKVFGSFPLTFMEAVQLCQDHYLFLVEKNAEDQRKNNQVRYPLHLERTWYEDFLSLPLLFLDA